MQTLAAHEKTLEQPVLHAVDGEQFASLLADGTPVLIRPLRKEDRELEEDFIMRLSPDSRRFRFMGDFKQPGSALMDQLMDVDLRDKKAFVAVVDEGGEQREIGVSRYASEPDGKRCECAITVADEWQHRGLGTLLMEHLIAIARKNGFLQLFSIDSCSNEHMRDLADHLGFTRSDDPSDETLVRYAFDL